METYEPFKLNYSVELRLRSRESHPTSKKKTHDSVFSLKMKMNLRWKWRRGKLEEKLEEKSGQDLCYTYIKYTRKFATYTNVYACMNIRGKKSKIVSRVL